MGCINHPHPSPNDSFMALVFPHWREVQLWRTDLFSFPFYIFCVLRVGNLLGWGIQNSDPHFVRSSLLALLPGLVSGKMIGKYTFHGKPWLPAGCPDKNPSRMIYHIKRNHPQKLEVVRSHHFMFVPISGIISPLALSCFFS